MPFKHRYSKNSIDCVALFFIFEVCYSCMRSGKVSTLIAGALWRQPFDLKSEARNDLVSSRAVSET